MQSAPTLADQLLDLFTTELQGVQFPEVDATSLTSHRDAVQKATRAVEDAEAALARAQGELAERKQALALHGKRALAYAKVFAEERPALRERLDLLARQKGTPLALDLSGEEPRRRGRPRKISEPLLAPEPSVSAAAE